MTTTTTDQARDQARIQSRAGLYRLSNTALHALCELSASGEDALTMTALSRRLGISSAGVTCLVDALEKINFLARQPSRTDRRKIWIILTESGRRALEDILHA